MIEIEKKVRLTPAQVNRIEEKGVLLKEIVLYDSYFDSPEYHYTAQNIWLRKRGDVFELKAGVSRERGSIDRYEEIVDEKAISERLGVDFKRAIEEGRLVSFCFFTTKRKQFQVGELHVDLDEADCDGLKYQVAEIEIVVDSLERVEEGEKKIVRFMEEMEIDASVPMPGKLIYFLYCKSRDHYDLLVKNKVALLLTDTVQLAGS